MGGGGGTKRVSVGCQQGRLSAGFQEGARKGKYEEES